MRFDMDNPHLDIEPVYDDVIIKFKDDRIVNEEDIENLDATILQLVETSPGKMFVLDFAKVKFMSSSALGFLLKVHKSVTMGKGRLRLRNMSPQIYEVFKITSLHKVFTIEKSK
jgi:anti-sigma B factor antagonist